MYRYIFLTQSYNILKSSSSFNKRKIINDPIYGFITIPDELLFDLIEIQTKPFNEAYIQQLKEKTARLYNLDLSLTEYFVYSDVITNKAYNPYSDRINILYKNNTVLDIAEASDQLNVAVLTETVSKYYLCYPKTLSS